MRLLNKSFVTNALALLIAVLGYFSPIWRKQLLDAGLYALSGAFTNWLAIYMLFEKVPYLYGSGVIPARFEEFKFGIRHLIMVQFFTPGNVERFFKEQTLPDSNKSSGLDISPLIEQIDYDELYAQLLQAVGTSPLGPMLAMMGGDKALQPMKEAFIAKMKDSLNEMSRTPSFQAGLQASLDKNIDSKLIIAKVEEIVQRRLDELTPRMVKDIIQEMIRAHLGWLVVWGGVFGGLIGLLAGVLT